MGVMVSIFLFGKPAWEIESLEGGELTTELIGQIRNAGTEIKNSLDQTAGILAKLLRNGWSGSGGLYDVNLYKDTTLEEARRELMELGLDPELASLMEDEDDDSEMSTAAT
jgi:hypothetical protein